jgi:hypothetical protein
MQPMFEEIHLANTSLIKAVNYRWHFLPVISQILDGLKSGLPPHKDERKHCCIDSFGFEL